MSVSGGPTLEQNVRRFLSTATKGRSTIEGDLYHQHLAIVLILRAYRSYQAGDLSTFIVAVEVEKAGKYDDIVYFHGSAQGSNGTFFMQAKHKKFDKYKIVKDALCTAWDVKSIYSIPMYFMSYLEVDRHRLQNSRYVLCTNATLHEDIRCYFNVIGTKQDNALQFCEDVEATCYQFRSDNPFPALTDTLRDACLAQVGTQLAQSVLEAKLITFQDTPINAFADFIYGCVEQLPESTSEPNESGYKFKQQFWLAADNTAEGKLRNAFRREYETKRKVKLNEKTLLELNVKIDTDSFTAARSTGSVGIFAKFDTLVDEFYGKFLLICNTFNVEKLREKAMALLPSSCDADRGTVFDKLQGILLFAMSSETPMSLDLGLIQYFFQNVERMTTVISLKYATQQFRQSLHAKHPDLKLNPNLAQRSPLHAFLTDGSSCGVYEFTSSLELTVSGCILEQMLSFCEYETVFVNSAEYSGKDTMIEIVEALLHYFKSIEPSRSKVLSVLGTRTDVSIVELKQLSEAYRQKIVVVERMAVSSGKGQTRFDQFFGVHLTDDAWCRLIEQSDRTLFGTATKPSMLVDRQDGLSLLLEVLKLWNDSDQLESHSTIGHNYERIKDWYIQRRFVPYRKEKHAKDSSFSEPTLSEPTLSEQLLESHDDQADAPVILDGASEKTCILLNDAGHGKSWYFTWLGWRLSWYDPSLYIVHFIANEYSTDFEQLYLANNVHVLDETQLVRLLYRYTHLALFVPNINKRWIAQTDEDRAKADRCAELITVKKCEGALKLELNSEGAKNLSSAELVELRLFRAKFNERKLVLMLDGFDEIVPEYETVVMRCFARFVGLDAVRGLYISSRPYEFEDGWGTFNKCRMYQLELFSVDNIMRSWHKFLQSKLDGYRSYRIDHCVRILRALYKVVCRQLKEEVKVPLMLHMVQTIFLPELATRVTPTEHTISSDMLQKLKLDKHQLVATFIDMKLSIFHIVKTGTTDAAVKTAGARKMAKTFNKQLKAQHMLLAMYVIFNETDRDALLTENHRQYGLEAMQEVIEGDETGFVVGVLNGMPRFVHRTFAEFFAALWLHQNRGVFRMQSVLKSRMFHAADAFKQMRYFFDCMLLKEECTLHRALLNRSPKQVTEVLGSNPSAIAATDETGRLAIHLATDSFFFDTLQGRIFDDILKHMPRCLLNGKDDLYGWSALDYALVKDDVIVGGALMKVGAQINVDNLLGQLEQLRDADALLKQALDYVSMLGRHEPHTEAIDMLCSGVASHLIVEKRVNISARFPNLINCSMLEYCVERSSVAMLHQLITQSGQRENIFDTLSGSLFNRALTSRKYNVAYYLMQYRNTLADVLSDNQLIECGEDALQGDRLEVFSCFFNELCMRQNIECIDDSEIVLENDDLEQHILFKADCCIRKRPQKTYSPAKEEDKCFRIKLLAKAVDVGKLRIASYIVQKVEMNVNLALVSQLMECFKRVNHKQSINAFKYLFSMLDLTSCGANLFAFIVKQGCLNMLPSLFALAFDPEQINVECLSELLHEEGEAKRTLYLFEYLQKQAYIDCFKPFDNGESLFDIAKRNRKLMITRMLLENQCRGLPG